MEYTLLQMTQEILSNMDSDEINTLSETTEAMQVARCIRQTYYNLIEDLNPPQHYIPFNLTATDSTTPTIMSLPDKIVKLQWIKYNKQGVSETAPFLEEVYFMPKDEFFKRMYLLNADETYIETFNYSLDGILVPIIYRTDRMPTYYTSLDNSGLIVFDSLDTAVETFLTGTKSYGYGRKEVEFQLTDSFIPDLEEPMFARLLNESKVLAFAELKSVDHAIANRDAKRARNRSGVDKYRAPHISDFDQLPNFSRKR